MIEELNKKLQLQTKKKSKCKKSISTQTIIEEKVKKQTKETQTTEYTERSSTSSSQDTPEPHPGDLEITSNLQHPTSEEERNEIEDLLRDHFLVSSSPISPISSISHLDRSEDERSVLCDSQMNGFVSSPVRSITNSVILSTNDNNPLPEISLDQIFQFAVIPDMLKPINSSPESTHHDEEVLRSYQTSRCISNTTTSVSITNPCVSMTTTSTPNDTIPVAVLTSQSSVCHQRSPPTQSPIEEHLLSSIVSTATSSASPISHHPIDINLEAPLVDAHKASSSWKPMKTPLQPFLRINKRFLNEPSLVRPSKISRISRDLSSSSNESPKGLEPTLKKIEKLGNDESYYKRLTVADVSFVDVSTFFFEIFLYF